MGEPAALIIQELRARRAGGIKSSVTGLGTRPDPDSKAFKKLGVATLDRILELDRNNFTVKAEAGVPVVELKNWLKKAGFSVALPALNGTLGGAIAAKAWPPMRDILLGMDVALADGSHLSFGGKTVKNVAGYDVMKLFCGSLGAYGVILTVTLRTESGRDRGEPADAERALPSAQARFTPDEYHRRLKRAFDPENLLNPWVYGERES
jgi:glycolate oxidase FAD binding subunit